MAYPPIVQLNVSEQLASTPNNLQQMGAIISQGATTLASGTYALLSQESSLTALMANSLALSSLTWSGGTVVATAAAALAGLSTGDTFVTTISGATPAGYNGTYLATVTGATTFTFQLAINPGAETVPGTYTPNNQGELLAMNSTFWDQGSNQGVYVLELGTGDGNSGPTALGTWLTANPGTFYSFLCPRLWDNTANYKALVAQYTGLSAKTYFFTTTTTSTYTNYPATDKSVLAEVEAPGLVLTEFSLAADFQHTLSYAPSSSNKMTPNAYAYLTGVTPYPSMGNNALLKAILAASANFVATGAEGGISNTLIMRGTTMDGNDFAWWYSVDNIQISLDQNLAAAVINGSNNPLAPLYYNQPGINTLQAVAVETVNDNVTYGLANGTVQQTRLDPATFAANINDGDYVGMNVVNAVPFTTYTEQNPTAYAAKTYGGLQVLYFPMNGITQVLINVVVTNITQG